MTTTSTPAPLTIPDSDTATAGAVVRCKKCGAPLVTFHNGSTAAKATLLVCGQCAYQRQWRSVRIARVRRRRQRAREVAR